jgi:hypothetical protein
MQELASDLMIGIKPIAEFLGISERQAFYLAEKRRLPLFKMGAKWVGRKSTITQDIAERENSAAEAAAAEAVA